MSDPYFANVVLLAGNDNAANGSSTFSDQSTKNHSFSNVNSPVYSNTTAPTGMTTSIKLAGTGPKQITVANSTDFDLGTSDFTIEGFVYLSSTANNAIILAKYDGTNNSFYFFYGAGSTLRMYAPGGPWVAGRILGTPSGTTWYHFAVTRAGSVFRFFLGGTQGDTVTNAGAFATVTEALSMTGDGTNGNNPTGTDIYLASVRITKGTARYTGNFSPPSLPLPTAGANATPVIMNQYARRRAA